jgi:septum formation protein
MVLVDEKLILASASLVRARLLAAAGVDFRVELAEIDEAIVKRAFRSDYGTPGDCALALAEAKARSVSHRHPCALVVGADQILVCGSEWYDKPAHADAARAQLQSLRGRRHLLATAACAVVSGERVWHHACAPELTMRNFSDRFLEGYLAAEGDAILGSVGAYRLEARGIQLFDRIEGNHFAILGLPLVELLGFLREYGALSG